MIYLADGYRVLSDAELNELRLTITDPNGPWAILLEMYDDSVGRQAYEELEKEHADFREQLARKEEDYRKCEEENDTLRARIAELENIPSKAPMLDKAMESMKADGIIPS